MSHNAFNPSDPLCSLPPDMAFHLMFARYVVVGTLSVYIWETLNNVLSDYSLLFRRRVRLPTVVYFMSKLFCLSFTIYPIARPEFPILFHNSDTSSTSPSTCNALEKTLDVFVALTIISTSLLFIFRIRAVFDTNPWIVTFFTFSWLAVVAACLVFVVKVVTAIGPKSFCPSNSHVQPFILAAAITPLVNSTLVFLAVAWRLGHKFHTRRSSGGEGGIIKGVGNHLLVFVKATLQDGQACYLITIIFNLVTVIFIFIPSLPDVLRTILAVPNIALMNIMACRVFRNTKFGQFREAQISSSLMSREFQAVIPLTFVHGEHRHRVKQVGDESSHVDSTEVTQTVERRPHCEAP